MAKPTSLNWNNSFEAIFKRKVSDSMQEFAKRLMRRLVQNTPRKTRHAVSEWKFCVGSPPFDDSEDTDDLAYTKSISAIESWDGFEQAYIYNNARKVSAGYPEGYMYLILVNDKTAIGGAGVHFIEKSIEEARKGIG